MYAAMRFRLTQKHVCVSTLLRNMCVFPSYSGTCVCFHLTQKHVCVSTLLRNMCVFHLTQQHAFLCLYAIPSQSRKSVSFSLRNMCFSLTQNHVFYSHVKQQVFLYFPEQHVFLILSRCALWSIRFCLNLKNMCFRLLRNIFFHVIQNPKKWVSISKSTLFLFVPTIHT